MTTVNLLIYNLIHSDKNPALFEDPAQMVQGVNLFLGISYLCGTGSFFRLALTSLLATVTTQTKAAGSFNIHSCTIQT